VAKEKFFEKMEKAVEEKSSEMSLEEARAFRASLAKPAVINLTDSQKREEFRKYWAQAKRNYGKAKDIEGIIWAHLRSSGMDVPEKFEAGLAHFGLKKIK
jgi:hypothetical protein